ncbi:hypothetical protein HJFPF1_10202 [Paramyrothecium foliicola]|nr:hypothetical protein HJFPF1_10202 [Paramyrothecium foliicola]
MKGPNHHHAILHCQPEPETPGPDAIMAEAPQRPPWQVAFDEQFEKHAMRSRQLLAGFRLAPLEMHALAQAFAPTKSTKPICLQPWCDPFDGAPLASKAAHRDTDDHEPQKKKKEAVTSAAPSEPRFQRRGSKDSRKAKECQQPQPDVEVIEIAEPTEPPARQPAKAKSPLASRSPIHKASGTKSQLRHAFFEVADFPSSQDFMRRSQGVTTQGRRPPPLIRPKPVHARAVMGKQLRAKESIAFQLAINAPLAQCRSRNAAPRPHAPRPHSQDHRRRSEIGRHRTTVSAARLMPLGGEAASPTSSCGSDRPEFYRRASAPEPESSVARNGMQGSEFRRASDSSSHLDPRDNQAQLRPSQAQRRPLMPNGCCYD